MSLQYTLVDIVPNSDSSETEQNSEPSIAVNPLNPMQMIAGAFAKKTNSPITFLSMEERIGMITALQLTAINRSRG